VKLARALLLQAGAASLACSTLPDYAAPKGRVGGLAEFDATDVVAYRTLERGDFRGSEPPAEFAGVAERMGAATCAYILTTPDTQLMLQAVPSADGSLRYEAQAQEIGFHARMDRGCSWWNAEQEHMPADYVLQHEQIHFALIELEARRMQASSAQIARGIRASAATPEEATRLAQEQLNAVIARHMKAVLERSREFDEDTSLGYRPERQQAWWARVRSELAAGEP
jgi:hypothetical protein